MPKPLAEKCRLCAKLTAAQAKQLHPVDGDGCWNSSICPNRRSHARHRDRRNQARNLKRWQEQGQVALVLTDSEIAPVQEQPIADAASSRTQIQFDTQLLSCVASVSAVGGCPDPRCWRRDLV